MGILIFLSSFNGVLLSGIIVYAGSLNQTSSFSDVLRFGAISILGWSAIYISNYYLEVTEASITKDINVKKLNKDILENSIFLLKWLKITHLLFQFCQMI